MNHSIRIAAVLLALGIVFPGGRAHAGLLDIFRSDLELTLVVDRTEGLRTGDAVEFQDETGRRQAIGRIAAIPDDGGGQPVVSVRIDARYKDRVRTGSRAVVDRSWAGEGPARIYIVTPEDQAASPPLRSGAVMRAQSLAADRAARIAGRVQAFMEKLLERSREYLDQLRSEVDRGNLDKFKDQLGKMAGAVSRYTREQKERFTREVLPELERIMESARRRFKAMQDPEKQKELEREYQRIKEGLAA